MNFNEIKSGLLNDEIQWGLHYREETKKDKKISLSPKTSPLNLKMIWEKYQITKQIQEIQNFKRQITAKPAPKHLGIATNNKINRVDRSAFTKNQYINFLATPHQYAIPPKKSRSVLALRRKLRRKQKCTARLIELAKPTKLRVYHTWKDYCYQFPAEVLERLNALLRTDHTLDPSFARCCFKDLDRKRVKEKYKKIKRRRRITAKKRQENTQWLKTQIRLTVELIINFLQHDALLSLNYKQMLISSTIIDQLVRFKYFKKRPMRNSSKPYQRAVVDVVDQLSVWVDTIVRYIDVQATESDQLRETSLESLLGPEEGEDYGEDYGKDYGEDDAESYATTTFGRKKKGKITGKVSETASSRPTTKASRDGKKLDKRKTDGDYQYDDTSEYETEVSSTSSKGIRTGGVGEEEGTKSYDTGKIRRHDNESLAKLIDILSKSSPEFLEKHIDELNMPGVTYEQILDKVKNLQDAQMRQEKEKRKNILEKSMVDWATSNEPDEVNENIISKIQSAAEIISECLKKEEDVKKEGIKDHVKFEKGAETPSSWGGKGETSSKQEGKRPLSMAGEDSELTTSKLTPLHPRKPGRLDTDQDISEMSSYGGADETTNTKTSGSSEGEPDKISLVKFKDHSEGEDERYVLEKVTKPLKSSVKKRVSKEIEATADVFGIISKHKPLNTYEHAPDTICCLTIKVWATWLLEVANNAQKWSEWLNDIIKEIRSIACIIRGEVLDDDGNMKMFYKDDWKKFVEKVENMIISWRQYNMHVKDLTDKIINNFHGKRITCCPKCLEDNLIVNIAVAHDISQQLAEAMNTASYWRRWLDRVVTETQRLTSATIKMPYIEATSVSSSSALMELIEIQMPRQISEESIYEIEEYEYCRPR